MPVSGDTAVLRPSHGVCPLLLPLGGGRRPGDGPAAGLVSDADGGRRARRRRQHARTRARTDR